MSDSGAAVDQPLVTVVMPTFDRPGYLKEALRSAVQQSYPNLEILVRDNASDRATGEVVRSFDDARIQYLRHPENIGMTPNFLSGFRAAQGRYVTTLHDDDFWAPEFVEKMVAVLETNPEIVLAFSDHYIVDQMGQIDQKATEKYFIRFGRASLRPGIHHPFKKLALIRLSVPMAVSTVVRRESIDWDDFPDVICDLWVSYLACRDGGACYYIPERLAFYRVHPTSASALARVKFNQSSIELYRRLLRDERVSEFHDAFRKRLRMHQTQAGIALLRQGDPEAAREMFSAAMRQGFDWKAALANVASYLPDAITRHLPGQLHHTSAISGRNIT